jgi:glycine dehydrogenase subunit 1
MRYLPHTPEDIAEMLSVVGVDSLRELFSTVPENCRRQKELNLPERLSEWELNDHIDALSGTMAVSPEYKVFIGAGSYEHFIPAAVPHLLSRGEFVTSYTPYQPELSQGTLQAIFEYQTLTTRLLGMEAANASQYDGASALAEAALMAIRVTRKKKVAVSRLIHPHYRQVMETYLRPTDYEIIELPYSADGTTDFSGLTAVEDLAGIALQSPNFFGCIENIQSASDLVQDQKCLVIACFTEPLAFGLIKNPGEQGAHIACGEGQSMGIPRTFGGPALGMFATRSKYVRNMPGRLVGQTTDLDGRRGFVLTLATREQHIRREKATSNICTNHSLCALASAIYMAALGGTGIKALARLNYDKCEYLKGELRQAGFHLPFSQPTFNEFVVELPEGAVGVYNRLIKERIIAGLPLECHYRELKNHYLLCATETFSKEDIDSLVTALKKEFNESNK